MLRSLRFSLSKSLPLFQSDSCFTLLSWTLNESSLTVSQKNLEKRATRPTSRGCHFFGYSIIQVKTKKKFVETLLTRRLKLLFPTRNLCYRWRLGFRWAMNTGCIPKTTNRPSQCNFFDHFDLEGFLEPCKSLCLKKRKEILLEKNNPLKSHYRIRCNLPTNEANLVFMSLLNPKSTIFNKAVRLFFVSKIFSKKWKKIICKTNVHFFYNVKCDPCQIYFTYPISSPYAPHQFHVNILQHVKSEKKKTVKISH